MTNDRYEPPEAIRLTDKDAAFGQCHDGSSASKPCGHGNKVVGYRENGFQGRLRHGQVRHRWLLRGHRMHHGFRRIKEADNAAQSDVSSLGRKAARIRSCRSARHA